ncbi:hypothetical protein CROQUDRAFT_110242 [Cronartium quercuum f. sp. fusiforme G11]|uniref:Oxysterol-binding protein n=1 Tax=Cronartium quercuum f. sp. fusiforme G11 TaxID=708437 RepID=A0A9P6NA43_9BASI|nr:hypothetical protein CROQUDRAFT_110242 [Cronartium quercuum f. sp. fusiforme G11]
MPILNRAHSNKQTNTTTTPANINSNLNHSAPNLQSQNSNSHPHHDQNRIEQSISNQEINQQEDNDTKFKQLLSVLKKAVGVKDLGNMRLSLPANLITPMGNLEYWCYLDRPDVFSAINESESELERMLAVLRWTFTKDSKFIHGPICKPYNSVLGEQFRCWYDVDPIKIDPITGEFNQYETTSEDSTSLTEKHNEERTSTVTTSNTNEHNSRNNSSNHNKEKENRVVFLNEQVSHHPPISCFWYESRNRSNQVLVQSYGVDQISAKFTGTSLKVFPGELNKGIFVRLPNRDEEYQITHPTATITGLLRASPYVIISDYTYITCRNSNGDGNGKLRAMINYLEESWIGKPKFLIEGIIYEINDKINEPMEYTKIKQVPNELIKVRFKGNWREKIEYEILGSENENSTNSKLLIDLSILKPLDKSIKLEQDQEINESRKFWKDLTFLIKSKNFSEATKLKLNIEQTQRDLVKKRENNQKSNFLPKLFDNSIWKENGKPLLIESGSVALQKEFDYVFS